jgi:tetratricopeptide (TPR) repeat protein
MKKILTLTALGLIGLAAICLYWNAHLYYRAKDTIEDPAERVRLLETANAFFPWNDLVQFELGKACFELGSENLGEVGRRDADFRKGLQGFETSLRLSPGSLQAHFQMAQSLLYMTYLSLPVPIGYFEEYKKTALLTGHNSPIFYEVGKVLFSRWPELSAAEKDFTLDILKKLLAQKDEEKLLTLLRIWDMNVKDYAVIDRFLPEDPAADRAYAGFLGERGLSLEERQKALSQAENLEYLKAKNEFEQGQRVFDYFQVDKAAGHFSACLDILKNIRFFQTLAGQPLIDRKEYEDLRKFAHLNLAKCKIEGTRRLEDAESEIDAYLSLEDQVAALGEFETFLKERGVLSAEPVLNVKSLKQLAFRLRLAFKQNRYRDITGVGASLERSLLIVPDDMKADLVGVLVVVGDAYQKLDYIYESEKSYIKALYIDPRNLDALRKLRKCYERLNDAEKAKAAEERFQRVLSPRKQSFERFSLGKGQAHPFALALEAGKITLNLVFSNRQAVPGPLVSLDFNGLVIWEGYAGPGGLALSVDAVTGPNSLVLRAVSGPVTPVSLTWTPAQP